MKDHAGANVKTKHFCKKQALPGHVLIQSSTSRNWPRSGHTSRKLDRVTSHLGCASLLGHGGVVEGTVGYIGKRLVCRAEQRAPHAWTLAPDLRRHYPRNHSSFVTQLGITTMGCAESKAAKRRQKARALNIADDDDDVAETAYKVCCVQRRCDGRISRCQCRRLLLSAQRRWASPGGWAHVWFQRVATVW